MVPQRTSGRHELGEAAGRALDARAPAGLIATNESGGQRMSVPPDIEIARAATLQPIGAVAEPLGIPEGALQQYGRHIAKLDLGYLRTLEAAPPGRLVLVTAI